jgi:hypothetical protein
VSRAGASLALALGLAAVAACDDVTQLAQSTTGLGGSGGAAGQIGGGGQAGQAGQAGHAGGGQAGQAGSGLAGGSGSGGLAGDGGGGLAGQAGQAGSGGAAAGWESCQDSDEALVRRAFVAVLGQRPSGSDEVRLMVDLMHAAPAAADGSPQGRAALVGALVARSGGRDYQQRWGATLADFLRVQRVDEVANPACFGTIGTATGQDPTAPARLVRDQPPLPPPAASTSFTMGDVITGSVRLDDLSPAYIANVMALVAKNFVGANADPAGLELARRSAVGSWFDGAYLHRDGVCLGCHNANGSPTYNPDPAKNLFFPIPGGFEQALFGAATGAPDDTEGGASVDGVTRAHAAFRYAGFSMTAGMTVDASALVRPWGWAPLCGSFATPDKVSTSIAPVNADLGAAQGVGATAWDVTGSLQRGFAKLRAHGVTLDASGQATDQDEALAYLVAMNIAEQVWGEVTGGILTVAHNYPRNAPARDLLKSLTDTLISSGFSLQAVLRQIVSHPIFNQPPPSAGCGPGPSAWPPIVDPWTVSDTDPLFQGNGVGDMVSALSPRTLIHAAYAGLGWQDAPLAQPLVFPSSEDDADLLADIGTFQKNAEPGFRGFDFQSTLAWELELGACAKPAAIAGDDDAIDQIAARAAATPGATLEDAIVMLKDRLVGRAAIDSMAESSALAALTETAGGSQTPLTAPAGELGAAGLTAALRLVCGALLVTPQFRLSGIEPGPGPAPSLAPLAGESYAERCAALDGAALGQGLMARCVGGAPSVVPAPLRSSRAATPRVVFSNRRELVYPRGGSQIPHGARPIHRLKRRLAGSFALP